MAEGEGLKERVSENRRARYAYLQNVVGWGRGGDGTVHNRGHSPLGNEDRCVDVLAGLGARALRLERRRGPRPKTKVRMVHTRGMKPVQLKRSRGSLQLRTLVMLNDMDGEGTFRGVMGDVPADDRICTQRLQIDMRFEQRQDIFTHKGSLHTQTLQCCCRASTLMYRL